MVDSDHVSARKLPITWYRFFFVRLSHLSQGGAATASQGVLCSRFTALLVRPRRIVPCRLLGAPSLRKAPALQRLASEAWLNGQGMSRGEVLFWQRLGGTSTPTPV